MRATPTNTKPSSMQSQQIEKKENKQSSHSQATQKTGRGEEKKRLQERETSILPQHGGERIVEQLEHLAISDSRESSSSKVEGQVNLGERKSTKTSSAELQESEKKVLNAKERRKLAREEERRKAQESAGVVSTKTEEDSVKGSESSVHSTEAVVRRKIRITPTAEPKVEHAPVKKTKAYIQELQKKLKNKEQLPEDEYRVNLNCPTPLIIYKTHSEHICPHEVQKPQQMGVFQFGNFSAMSPALSDLPILDDTSTVLEITYTDARDLYAILKARDEITQLLGITHEVIEDAQSKVESDYSGYIESKTIYNNNVILTAFGKLEQGKPVGRWIHVCDGIVIACTEYKEGKAESIVSYHSNGVEKSRISLKNGCINGLVLERYTNGGVYKTSEYIYNMRHGLRHYYDESGNHVGEGAWIYGKKEGVIYSFSPMTKEVISLGAYKNDVLIEGRVIPFDPKTILKIEESMRIYKEKNENFFVYKGYKKYGYPKGMMPFYPFGSRILGTSNSKVEVKEEDGVPTYYLKDAETQTSTLLTLNFMDEVVEEYVEAKQQNMVGTHRGFIRDGKRNGTWDTVSGEGRLQRRGYYKDGVLHGEQYQFHNKEYFCAHVYDEGEYVKSIFFMRGTQDLESAIYSVRYYIINEDGTQDLVRKLVLSQDRTMFCIEVLYENKAVVKEILYSNYSRDPKTGLPLKMKEKLYAPSKTTEEGRQVTHMIYYTHTGELLKTEVCNDEGKVKETIHHKQGLPRPQKYEKKDLSL